VTPLSIAPVKLNVEIETVPLTAPFRITGRTYETIDLLVVTLESSGCIGRGEAAGVYYRNESVASMQRQIDAIRQRVESRMSRDSVQTMLAPGGARNALDCALWDLEAKLTGRFAWEIAELQKPRPLLTLFTCGADEPERMAVAARGHEGARALKLKLTGEPVDADRVRAVREARADVWLSVDANQGFTREFLEQIMPVLIDTRVELIEQPFPNGQDALLDDFHSPITIAADESVQSLSDIPGLLGRFGAINIKLDKCGGVSEALAMARAARESGLHTWVGNMIGTSLAMAPAFLVGQLCDAVELDGPLFLKTDRADPVQYADGFIDCPDALWGGVRVK
jgi:L-Ala-D/L-Glu epimerase